MSDKVLFSITEKHLNTGLRGFPVGHVRTSAVSPEKGVSYVGYPVIELADRDPEQVIFLLLNKHWPSEAESVAFKADLAERSTLPEGVIDLIKQLPKEGHPMEWLISGLLFLGMYGKTGDFREDALNLTARVNEVVAAIFRIRSGWGDPIPSEPERGYVENFVHMLGVPGTDPAKLTKLLRAFHILHYDHGGGNLSTFTGKAVASGLADIYASMAAAMAGLYGPRHGRANQACLQLVKEVGTDNHAEIDKIVRDRLANRKLIYGFGHAVLRAEDPRATFQYGLGKELYPDDPLFKTAFAMREVIPPILLENPKISNPYPNVDAVSGTLLNATGLTSPDYYTVLFGWSRTIGISAQIVDERMNFRNGKGVPIYRCGYIAENQEPKSLK